MVADIYPLASSSEAQVVAIETSLRSRCRLGPRVASRGPLGERARKLENAIVVGPFDCHLVRRRRVIPVQGLRLIPGDAEILSVYSSWAVSFGQPQRGTEAADRRPA
jgi:hypothetical protein